MKTNSKSLLAILSATVVLFASCQKVEIPFEASSEIDEVELVTPENPNGHLVSATKLETIPVQKLTEELLPKLKSSQDIITIKLLGKELVDFSIVTYTIKYRSKTIVDGRDTSIVLSGNVAYIVDKAGNIKRHIESVTLYNTFYNTSKSDTSWGETCCYYLRSIYNALVVFPLYQGGDAEEEDALYVTSTEFIIKAKQAIDCELAALEFIEQQENVEMMPDYYTEIIGVSNGGGPALAEAYILENDEEYSQYSDEINLLSTYVGAGNCSSRALINNVLNMTEESDMYTLAGGAYIPVMAGAYCTWRSKHFEGIELKDYFSDTMWNYRLPGYGEYNPVEIYVYNLGSMMYLCSLLPPIKESLNPEIMNEDKTAFNLDDPKMVALCNAFDENEIINHGWSPKSPIRFVHSTDDELLSYDANYQIWKDLSDDGANRYVRMETMTGLNHLYSAYQCMINVVFCKHPFYSEAIVDVEDIIDYIL